MDARKQFEYDVTISARVFAPTLREAEAKVHEANRNFDDCYYKVREVASKPHYDSEYERHPFIPKRGAVIVDPMPCEFCPLPEGAEIHH